MCIFLAGSFSRSFAGQGRDFISRAYMYRPGWASRLTGGLPSFLSLLSNPMNAQVAEVHFAIIKLGRAIRTNPEAELTAYTLILINQGYAGLNILIKGRAGAGSDTGRIQAMHTRNRQEVLVYSVIEHFGPNLIYSNQLRTFWITNRWCYRMRG